MMGALAFLAGPAGRWLVVALVMAAAIGGAWWRGHASGLESGRAAVQARWDADKLRQQDVALQAQAAAREQEHSMAASVAAVADHYVKENARAKIETADLRRRLADGSLRLTVPGACPGGDPAAAPAGGSGGGDGRASADLPRPIAAALLDLGDEADAVVRQLTACQAVVRAERAATP
jgi:prophage endopeptidase